MTAPVTEIMDSISYMRCFTCKSCGTENYGDESRGAGEVQQQFTRSNRDIGVN
jgi:hypothetical protein